MLARNRILSHAIIILLLISAVPLIAQLGSENASADSPEIWNQTSGALASTDANWLDGTKPIAGDNIIFNATSTASCTWDLALALGSFTMTADYSGTVTIAANTNWGTTGDITLAAGTLTGDATSSVSCGGDFVGTGGTSTLLNLIMTTDDKTVSGPAFGYAFRSLRISANTTLSFSQYIGAITVDSGKTLTIGAGIGLIWCSHYVGAAYLNSGIIAGTGALSVLTYNIDVTMSFGVVNCPVRIYATNDCTANRKVTVSANTVFGAILTIDSEHVARTITLDLSASNYALSATDITIGVRGILKGRASQITASGNFDSSAGSYLPESSSLHLTGASKILKTNGVAGFQNLFLDSSGSYTLSSNVTTYKYWGNGTLTKGSYNLYVNNDQAPAFTSGAMGTEISWLDDYSYDANATDQENETLTYGLDTDMPDLTVNTSTGVVSSSQPQANGTFYVHVSVTDGNHTVWLNASVTVTNLAPGITSRPRMSVVQYESYFYLVVASDPEGATLTVNISTNAPWLTVNPNGSISGSPLHRDVGTWLINVSVWDGYRTTYDNYSIEVSTLDSATMMLVMTTLAFALGALLLIVGFKDNTFWILAGPVWVISGLLIFIDYGVVFLLVSVGLGIVLMFKGVSPYL